MSTTPATFLVISQNAVQFHTPGEDYARRCADRIADDTGRQAKVVNLNTLAVVYDTTHQAPVLAFPAPAGAQS